MMTAGAADASEIQMKRIDIGNGLNQGMLLAGLAAGRKVGAAEQVGRSLD